MSFKKYYRQSVVSYNKFVFQAWNATAGNLKSTEVKSKNQIIYDAIPTQPEFSTKFLILVLKTCCCKALVMKCIHSKYFLCVSF